MHINVRNICKKREKIEAELLLQDPVAQMSFNVTVTVYLMTLSVMIGIIAETGTMRNRASVVSVSYRYIDDRI
jgi:hypothetical protein